MGCLSNCWSVVKRWRARKGLVAGIIILLVVDVIWVGSAAITRDLFHHESYEKPLFTTYFKTTLFSIYLVAFLFWKPWQRLCVTGRGEGGGTRPLQGELCQAELSLTGSTNCGVNEQTGQCEYQKEEAREREGRDGEKGEEERQEEGEMVREGEKKEEEKSKEEESKEEEGGSGAEVAKRYFKLTASSSINGEMCPIGPEVCLVGPPEFEPLKYCDTETDDESEHERPLPPCKTKCCKVRFKRTIEVRQVQGGLVSEPEWREGTERVFGGQQEVIEPLTVPKVALLSFIFGILWFFANYLYALALDKSSVASVNTLSALSSVFVMLLVAIPTLQTSPSDKFTLSRFLVTVGSVAGAMMVSLSSSLTDGGKGFHSGALFAVGGAIIYACYIVMLKRAVPHLEALEIPMFFGFVGLFDAIIILPLVVVWQYANIETFEIPPNAKVWTLLLVNGFIGTVLSELLWLLGVFLTSPLLGTLSLALVTPLSVAYSIVVGNAVFSWVFFLGAALVTLSFIALAILDQFGAWDPLWAGIKKLCITLSSYSGFYSASEESRRLLSRNQCSNEYDYLF